MDNNFYTETTTTETLESSEKTLLNVSKDDQKVNVSVAHSVIDWVCGLFTSKNPPNEEK